MARNYLSIFHSWIESSTSIENCSIVKLLEQLGYDDIVWLIISNKEIYLLDSSKELGPKQMVTFSENNYSSKIREWLDRSWDDQNIDFGDRVKSVLFLNKDKFGNISVILSDTRQDSIDLELKLWMDIAIGHYNSLQKINTLENAIRISYIPDVKNQLDKVSKITLDTIKPNFLDSVIPFVFYSYIHEEYGPYIFDAVPKEMLEPDYIITAVKLYSGLDAEMVAQMGHVFKNDPIKVPVMGEIFSIVFTLPNQNARGEFEMHSISLLIPHEFYNLSKSIIGDFKAKLFSRVEKIRLSHEEKDWSLAVDKFGSSEFLKEEITPILAELRSDIALTYTLMMDPEDVLNW